MENFSAEAVQCPIVYDEETITIKMSAYQPMVNWAGGYLALMCIINIPHRNKLIS